MKINKDYILPIAISAVILLAWSPISKYFGWDVKPAPAAQKAPATQSPVPAAAASAVAAQPAAQPVAQTIPVPAAIDQVVQPTLSGAVPVSYGAVAKIRPEVLKNSNMEVQFSVPEAALIDSISMLDYRNAQQSGQVILDNNLNNTLNPPLQPGALSINGLTPWTVENLINHGRNGSDNSYQVERLIKDAAGNEFKLLQSWKLSGNYMIDCQIKFQAVADKAVVLGPVLVSGGDLPSWARISGDKVRGSFHKIDYAAADGRFVSYSADEKDESFVADAPAAAVQWIGVSNKYFVIALKGAQPFQATIVRLGDKSSGYLAGISAMLPNVVIPANGCIDYSFTYYAGPKIVADLEAFAPSANGMMHLSWGPLDYLARFMLTVLSWFYSLCGSYGWSIIILTLVVRILFFPITRKANLSMKKMATIQPKIKELREKYKDKPELLNQKTMEMYRTEKINPLGGCLPMLLQIPVFFALYAALNGAIQLRQVSFWWSPDLAGPDTVAHIFGLAINPLVIAMTALMVLQQHITPSAMDPMQKKMMYAMPIVMLFFFYDLPSGLTLYWTVSQIFSILQMQLQRKWDHKDETPAAVTAK